MGLTAYIALKRKLDIEIQILFFGNSLGKKIYLQAKSNMETWLPTNKLVVRMTMVTKNDWHIPQWSSMILKGVYPTGVNRLFNCVLMRE